MDDYDDVEWENEEGDQISKIKKENNECIGETDPISLDEIQTGDEIKLDGQCYSKKNLLEWLKRNNTLPHNRRPITQYEIDNRDYRGGKKYKTKRYKTKSHKTKKHKTKKQKTKRYKTKKHKK